MSFLRIQLNVYILYYKDATGSDYNVIEACALLAGEKIFPHFDWTMLFESDMHNVYKKLWDIVFSLLHKNVCFCLTVKTIAL